MGIFSQTPQLLELPEWVESEISTPFEIAVKVYLAFGASNEEFRNKLQISDRGETVPVDTTEVGLSYQFATNAIRFLDKLGYRREPKALQHARGKNLPVTWKNAAAAILTAKDPPFLKTVMEGFSDSIQNSQFLYQRRSNGCDSGVRLSVHIHTIGRRDSAQNRT